VRFLQERKLSQRRACWLVGISSSSLRYRRRPDRNAALVERLKNFAYRKVRAGYRSALEAVRREGETVNHKRVYRLWKQEGLALRRRSKRRKKSALATVPPIQASRPGQVWTYDFIADACLNGRKLKILSVVDEFTRECLVLPVESRLPASKVQSVLERLFREHGAPEYLRSDNGPEFVDNALRKWLKQQGTQTVYIEKGCPWQNGFVESFHARFRDEFLNQQVFLSLLDAQVRIGGWRREYNRERPHSSLGYKTPEEFKQRWKEGRPIEPSGQMVLTFPANGD
jgi:putative transposase